MQMTEIQVSEQPTDTEWSGVAKQNKKKHTTLCLGQPANIRQLLDRRET